MTIQLAELAVANTIDYLQTHLGQYVMAVNAEWADDIVITTPLQANYHRAEQPPFGSGQLPAIYVIAEQSTGIAEDPSSFESEHDLTIGVITAGDTPDRVRTALYRYVQALYRCIWAVTHTAGIASQAMRWGTPYAAYHNVFQNTDRPNPNFFMDAHLSVIASLWELA